LCSATAQNEINFVCVKLPSYGLGRHFRLDILTAPRSGRLSDNCLPQTEEIMPDVIYPSALVVEGPILISIDDLGALDSLIADAAPKISEAQRQMIPELVGEKIRDYVSIYKPKEVSESLRNDYTKRITERLAIVDTEVTVHLSDQSVVKGKSFKEAVKHERLSEKYVLSFESKVEIGDVKATIDCGPLGRET
jgi:hypothetical protein